jgi:hypothetical protein
MNSYLMEREVNRAPKEIQNDPKEGVLHVEANPAIIGIRHLRLPQ